MSELTEIDELVADINSTTTKKSKNQKKKERQKQKKQMAQINNDQTDAVNNVVNDEVNKKSTNETGQKKKNKSKMASIIAKQIKAENDRLEAERLVEEKSLEEEYQKQLLENEIEAERQKQHEIEKEKERELKRLKTQRQKDQRKEQNRMATLARLGIDPGKIPSKQVKRPIYNKKRKQHDDRLEHSSQENQQDLTMINSDVDDWEEILDKIENTENISVEDSSKSSIEIESKKEEVKERIKAPICCILGNVDAGKTTFVDKIRSTKVQLSEAGGITQTINTVFIDFKENKFNIPGAILIDTPGHDSFYNLRSFGASLCNFVLLMVDIMEGVKEQTKKSIELIKKNKIPYVIVLNKLDRINDWDTNEKTMLAKNLQKQNSNATKHFEDLVSKIQLQFAEEGLNVELHFRNTDQRNYASMFPVSSHTGEGIKELFMGMMKLITKYLKQEISWTPQFKGVLTDSHIHKGLGRYVSMLMYDGCINKKDTLVLTGINGPIVKPISKLLFLDNDNKKFTLENEIFATRQLEVVLKGNDEGNYIMGSPIYLLSNSLNKTDLIKETQLATKTVQSYVNDKIEELNKNTSKHGILLHASSFGGLTAIMEYLDEKGIPYIDAKIGTVRKQDISKVLNFNTTPETEMYNIIVCFNTEPDKRAVQELQGNSNVTLIQENIIYRIFEQLDASISKQQTNIKDRYEKLISYPVIMEILEDHIYAKRDPIIVGVNIKEGILKKGTVIQCLRKNKKLYKRPDDLIILGIVSNIKNTKGIDMNEANIGDTVSIQIDNYQQQTPKLFNRDFDVETELWAQMTGDTYYILKKYFYDTMNEDCQRGFHKLSQIYCYESADSYKVKKYDMNDDEEYW